MKGNGRWQEAKIGIVLAGIMLAFVLAAMVPMVSAESRTDNFNYILKQPAAQKVLIGQNLQFERFGTTPVTISRIVSGDIENVYQADANNRIYNVNWPTSGAFYVNYRSATDYDAPLSVEEPDMPLKLKIGTKEVSSIALKTNLIIDTGGMNLFPEDKVDLVVIGPDGQIKHDEVNNQQFTGITVEELVNNYGSAANTLETSGWSIGAYTFKVKTKSDKACGLEAESDVKPLKILKGEITIEAETTSTVELDTLKLMVTGVADDKIKVEADPLSEYVIFKEGIKDTPTGADFHGNWFTDVIDSDGIRQYAVEFNKIGTYTIKVTVTGGDREGDSDTVDITVLEKEVVFDLPDEVVIGEKLDIKGTATSGTSVDVYVDDTLYDKLDDLVIVDGEFSKEVTTTEVGMNVPGSVRLKAWIDCECHVPTGEESTTDKPTRSPDGETAILQRIPKLTAELSTPVVALEDDFRVEGFAMGQTEVTILSVPPKGGGGKSLLDKGEKGLSPEKTSVSTTDYTYSKKMPVQKDATAGYYDLYVLCAGMDEEWGMTGEVDLEAALDEIYGIPSLTTGIITTKTQAEIKDILEDLVYTAGSDDLMVELRLKVETAFVRLDPIAAVAIGEPLVVTGTSNRQEGYVLVVTCKGPVELCPWAVRIENGAFEATFDTTSAIEGEYTVKVYDGDGHTDEVKVDISVPLTREEAIGRLMAEVIQSSPNADMLVAYGLQHPLSASDVLQSLLPADIELSTAPIGPPYTHGGAWFFWIDDRPLAAFAHPTRFVLIDLATGAVEVKPEEWWPVVNGEPYWNIMENRENSADIVYQGRLAYANPIASNLSIQYAANRYVKLAQKPKGSTKFAILVGGSEESAFNKLIEDMEKQLKKDGFPEKNIIKVRDSKAKRVREKLIKAFEDIVIRIKTNKIKDPELLFYYVGHGNKNSGMVFTDKGYNPKGNIDELLAKGLAEKMVYGSKTTLISDKGLIDTKTLAGNLLHVPSEKITVIIDACKSGGAIDELSDIGLKGQVLTAANKDGIAVYDGWFYTSYTTLLIYGREKEGHKSFLLAHEYAKKEGKTRRCYKTYPLNKELTGKYRNKVRAEGKVINKSSPKKILKAKVTIKVKGERVPGTAQCNFVCVTEDGRYKIELPWYGVFDFKVEAEGYKPSELKIGLTGPLFYDFELIPERKSALTPAP